MVCFGVGKVNFANALNIESKRKCQNKQKNENSSLVESAYPLKISPQNQ